LEISFFILKMAEIRIHLRPSYPLLRFLLAKKVNSLKIPQELLV
jgi:hypothetical protein